VDLGLSGRTALVRVDDEGLRAGCVGVLEGEGVTVVSELGDGVDIVVARAMPSAAPLLDCESPEELHAAWDSVVGTVGLYREALPAMTARRWGRFVWIGSAGARSLDADSNELGAVVSLAMTALNKVIRAEAGPANVTANAVLAGGPATTDDIAATVAFLCSEGAGYLTGVTVTVDGGAGSAVF
jgi:NAD(P)-dependent dehydrogenase (short-subunit alcohol dehydrogenase family)